MSRKGAAKEAVERMTAVEAYSLSSAIVAVCLFFELDCHAE